MSNDNTSVRSTTIKKTAFPVINNAKQSQSVDEYSMDFSEIIPDNSYYNDKFEEESTNSRILGGNNKFRQRTPSKPTLLPVNEEPKQAYQNNKPSEPVVQSNMLPNALPSVSVQALKAEVAIEELSKEVIKLRNQHRSILHERRTVIEETNIMKN